jgi:hypothetical protein
VSAGTDAASAAKRGRPCRQGISSQPHCQQSSTATGDVEGEGIDHKLASPTVEGECGSASDAAEIVQPMILTRAKLHSRGQARLSQSF